LLVELNALEHDDADSALTPPPLDERQLRRWAGAWFSVAGLHRLRAEQLRRAGDYVGAIEELDEASRASDQRPHAALPQWGRVILSEALRLAGDFEGAYEVAAAAAARAEQEETHPWVVTIAERALARALLALDEIDEALACFRAMARAPLHRNADSAIACDLGIGEALRRLRRRAASERHLLRASTTARDHGHTVGWIHAQLCLAELARDRGEDRGHVAGLVAQVHRELLLVEHPWLRLRAFVIGAVSASGPRAERLIGRAEDELLRFHRRSCDLELERDLVERCRFAVTAGVPADPIEFDFL
jgi:tetratricopeptide (TPR) repeat protein